MMIRILQDQLEAANASNIQLNATIKSMEANFNATVASLHQTISDLRRTVANLESLLREREQNLDKADAQMRGLKATFLPKQSEKQAQPAVQETEEEKAAEEQARRNRAKARGNNGARRRDYFTIEEREDNVYPQDIGVDEGVTVGIRDVIRYEMIRPSFVKHVYHVYTLKKGDLISSGRAPIAPLQNSRFDGSFIAGIAELRYLYSMPVERIVKYFHGNGFDLDRQTAHGLLEKAAGLFDKLYGALHMAVKEGKYLNCDETYHTVLIKSKDNEVRGSRKGYIWVIACASSGLVYFFYDDGSRSEKVILNELRGYEGVIQSDGLGAYKKVALQSGGKTVRVSCLQHCKRAFLEDDIKDNPDAKEVAELANLLYRNEHKHCIGKEGWSAQDNLKWRRQYAPPILKALKSKLEEIRGNEAKYPPRSQMHRAANYFLNEWDGIEAIPKYGDVDWDNNRLERINRYISLSRRNSLFFGSHAGAQRGCIFYSLACSCRILHINFFDYISDILNKTAALPPGSPIEAYRNLLPDKWTKDEQGQ